MQDMIADKKANITEQLANQREALRATDIKSVVRSMAISVPTNIANTVVNAPGLVHFGVLAASVGLTLIDIHASRKQERKKAKASFPYHYLLSLNGEFPSKNLQREYIAISSRYFMM
jgi:hypothetical protein